MSEAAVIKEKEIRPLLREVSQILRRHLPDPGYRILLFGSWATLDSTPTSDVDVGILGSEPVDEVVLARIKEEIDRIPTLRKIEVVDLQTVDDRFRATVEKHAERIA